MWLLSTRRAELRLFTGPSHVSGGYAILSHTWAEKEQTFQDLQAILFRCNKDGELPRDHVSDKIRNCCILAEQYGYDWVWIDSCCINKESSAELSEAINSMFRWYVLAEVCFAFLDDVPADEDVHADDSAFRMARWHTRGWTLQELLAPTFLIFLSREWIRIGTKLELSRLLSTITGIREGFITRQLSFHSDASIAERMHWASSRRTTRVEDEAYCLLGLFGISMPTLYGEGEQAFQRLQHELVRTSYDLSILLWGEHVVLSGDLRAPVPVHTMRTVFHGVMHGRQFCFAQSPHAFACPSISYTLESLTILHTSDTGDKFKIENIQESSMPFEHGLIPSFELTSLGMSCRLPIADVAGATIAVLPGCRSSGQYLGLLLHPATDDESWNALQRTYYVSWAFKHHKSLYFPGLDPLVEQSYSSFCRFAAIGSDPDQLQFMNWPIKPAWRDIYICSAPRPGERGDCATRILNFLPDYHSSVPFRVPRRLLSTLTESDFLPSSGGSISSPDSPWKAWAHFVNMDIGEGIRLVLGLCSQANRTSMHWAWAEPWRLEDSHLYDESWKNYAHSCNTDHIATWPGSAKEFRSPDLQLGVRLAFAPCSFLSKETLVLDLERLSQ